ncbi:hypothetical protein DAI22_10g050100 [Oryza sativa Japonica Group]|nr:hypothetical protein DAI22_10g050100 [Oryza sativa Japonica Group]
MQVFVHIFMATLPCSFLDRFSGSYNNTSLLKMLLYIPDAWWLSLVFKALTRKFTDPEAFYLLRIISPNCSHNIQYS